jgi:nicotinate-nucleotide adenylyltransferase
MLRTQVSERYEFDAGAQAFFHPDHYTVYYCEVTSLDISSSRIRELLARGCSVRYLLPDGVEDYIRQQGIYQKRREA